MNDPHEITIRLQAIDGQWETCGVERLRGVVPQNFQATANRWGSDTCSFVLRREPGAIYPDLSAFTPIEVEVAGSLCWSGRIKETPTKEGSDPAITVQGEGWQYHLDDDQYKKVYVHTNLADWKDVRSFLFAPLGQGVQKFPASCQIMLDGAITLAYPKDIPVGTNESVGVTLDFGSDDSASWARRVVVTWTSSNAGAGIELYGITSETQNPYQAGAFSSFIGAIPNGPTVAGTTSGTISTPRRYLTFLMYRNGGPFTPTTDIWFKLSAIKVFTDTAYESGQASILTADQVIKDSLSKATLLLSSDRTGITAGSFAIPSFSLAGYASPREVWQAVNSYENYEMKIDDRRPVYRAQVTAPIYEIGQWSGAEFEDASANSTAEIVNRVYVEGQDPAGPIVAVRATAPTSFRLDSFTPQAANPSFTTDLTGWTVGDGSINRDTSVFDTTPASLRLDKTSVAFPEFWTEAWTAPFVPYAWYRIVVRLRATALFSDGNIFVRSEPGYSEFNLAVGSVPTGSFQTFTLDFQPAVTTAHFEITTEASSTGGVLYLDSVEVYRAVDSVIDKRGFVKSRTLPITNTITAASANRIGDLFLQQHRTTPFTGSFNATGQGGIRMILGGETIHPASLLRNTGQLVRCSHVTDPDTGGVGRDGRIAAVNYDHDALRASVTLDNLRSGFEALLERLSVVVGSG